MSDSRHFKFKTSHVIQHFKLLDPPILALFLLQFDCPYGSLARSVPKPLKVPSLARSVHKPLKVPRCRPPLPAAMERSDWL